MTVYLGCYADEAHPNGLKALELDNKIYPEKMMHDMNRTGGLMYSSRLLLHRCF